MKNEIINQGATAQVYLYDRIGESFFGGISAAEFVQEIDALAAEQITVRINSPGGDVFEGFPIYNALTRHSAAIEVQVDGLAASIAAVIALAGDDIQVAENATMMIHDAYMITAGTAGELRKAADTLENINDSIVATVVARSGQKEERVRAWMAAETYFTAVEAVDCGLADTVAQPMKVAAAVYDEAEMRAALKPKRQIPQAVTPEEPKLMPRLRLLQAKRDLLKARRLK